MLALLFLCFWIQIWLHNWVKFFKFVGIIVYRSCTLRPFVGLVALENLMTLKKLTMNINFYEANHVPNVRAIRIFSEKLLPEEFLSIAPLSEFWTDAREFTLSGKLLCQYIPVKYTNLACTFMINFKLHKLSVKKRWCLDNRFWAAGCATANSPHISNAKK